MGRRRWAGRRSVLAVPLAVSVVVGSVGLVACEPGVDCNPAVYHPGADLSGTDQSGKVLTNCDLSGVDFAGATFDGADLSQARLGGADLTGAVLGAAKLSNADLTGADLTDLAGGTADLRNARLAGATVTRAALRNTMLTLVSSGGLIGTPASLPLSWQLKAGHLVGAGANLTGADFTGTTFTLSVLTDAVLTGANLTDARLQFVDLAGARLAGATLTRVRSLDVTGAPTSLPPGWTVTKGYVIGPTATLWSAGLSNADLTSVDLTDTNLLGALLDGADLSGANLTRTLLEDADLTGAVGPGNATSAAAVYGVGTICADGDTPPPPAYSCAGIGTGW